MISKSQLKKLAAKYKLHTYFANDNCNRPHRKFFLLSIRDQPKNTRILDLCCGTGFQALCLKKEGYLNYTGVDNNQNTIAAGKEIFKEANIEAKIFCEDACKTHFEDSSFNIVCAWQVSYFDSMDVQALIKEAHRLLMNDGLFFMDVAGVKKLEWHQNVYSKKRMKELLNDFSDIRFHPLTAEKYIVSARRC